MPPLLSTLIEEGAVEKAPGMRYRLVGHAPPVTVAAAPAVKKGFVTGRLRVHPAGYGFVVRDDGEDDVYVGARNPRQRHGRRQNRALHLARPQGNP